MNPIKMKPGIKMENDTHFHQMIEEVKDYAILSLNTTGDIISWNKGAERIKGYKAEEIIGKNFKIFYSEEDQKNGLPQSLLKKAFKEGRAEDSRWRMRKDGTKFWGNVILTPIHDDHGQIIGFSKITRDLTEKKEAEEELKKSNEQFFSFFNLNPVATAISSVDGGKFQYVNDAFLKLFELEREQVLNKTIAFLNLIAIDTADPLKKALNAKETIKETEYKLVGLNGKVKHLLVSINFIKNGAFFMNTIVNVTKRKEAEQKIRQLLEFKNKEMTQFVYIASHDLREPLLTIKNYVSLLLSKVRNIEEESKKHLQSISKAADRMELLICSLLDYSRLDNVKSLQQIDCNEILEEVKEDLNNLITSTNAKIIVHSLPIFNAYPLELKLLFQNLINNAIKFRKKTIPPEIVISANKIDNGWEFEVKDNGIGIEDVNKEKIFILFRQLHHRDEYEGAGIGLAHCKKIAELHNGTIWVESKFGEYSSFHFTILT
jgi:PAS domain S-box-containing protein